MNLMVAEVEPRNLWAEQARRKTKTAEVAERRMLAAEAHRKCFAVARRRALAARTPALVWPAARKRDEVGSLVADHRRVWVGRKKVLVSEAARRRVSVVVRKKVLVVVRKKVLAVVRRMVVADRRILWEGLWVWKASWTAVVWSRR